LNIELFGCSGGMAEGFRRAGIEFDLVVDRDMNCCRSYRHNIGSDRVVCGDVNDLVGAPAADVDLLVADPPCTPWSRAGKRRGLDDERDMLGATMEIIARWLPRRWLIANVPGLDDADHWLKVVQPVIGHAAAQLGYCVDFARLNAADYSVPQFRIRPFWFGHEIDTPCIRWPRPTHGRPSATPTLPAVDGVLPWVTCRDVLAHLSKEEIGRPVRKRLNWGGNGAHGLAGVICAEPPRSQKNVQPDWWYRKSPADEPTRAISTRANNKLDWPWDRPETTVCADHRIPPPGHHGNNSYMSQGIALSEKAATILQGFPETWRFFGKTKKTRWNQIGQAMPPPLAEAVARSIGERPYG
jgi:DNA (cytosine-5)-methyltransferase 1